MASADTENAGGVHAMESAPGGSSDVLEQRIDELLKDVEQNLDAFDRGDPPSTGEGAVSGAASPPIDEPFDLAALSAELESALRQAEAVARDERETERQAPEITPDSMVAVAVSATAGAGAIGDDGESMPLIDLEALDDALAQAADAVGFGIGGVEFDPPRAERFDQMARVVDEPVAVTLTEPVLESVPAPIVNQVEAPVVEEPAETVAESALPAPSAEPISEPTPEPQIDSVHVEPAQLEVAVMAVAAPVSAPPPAPVKRKVVEAPSAPAVPRENPLVAVLRVIASPLTVMSPAVRDLVGWLGLLTAFNAACVWVFVILVGPGNWPTASAHASPAAHKESSGAAHGGGHGEAKPSAKDAHGAHAAPAKKDAGHAAPKKPGPHAPPKSKKKSAGHGGH